MQVHTDCCRFRHGLLASSFATAQLSAEKVAATNRILQQVKATIAKLPPSHQRMLDGYANINHLATAWQRYGMRLADPSFTARANFPKNAAMPAPTSVGMVPVSNPSTDVAFSSFGGFTQSETSTARCGQQCCGWVQRFGQRLRDAVFFHSGTGARASAALPTPRMAEPPLPTVARSIRVQHVQLSWRRPGGKLRR